MLIKYKSTYRKIAMGLLSYIPSLHRIHTLRQIVAVYEENPEWELYLWKQDGDIIGAIGIKLHGQAYALHHIAVSPSFRNEGIGFGMIERLCELKKQSPMCATLETKAYLEKCWEKQAQF